MLVKRSVGVAPEVILRNPLYTGKEALLGKGFTFALKHKADITTSPKWVPVASQKVFFMSPKTFI